MPKLLLFLIVLFLFGCSTKSLSPSRVSDYFWSAQQSRDYNDVKKFVRSSDIDQIKLQQSIEIKHFSIDQPEISKSKKLAKVPTKLYIAGFFKNDPSSEIEIDFDTILSREGDSWKVNMRETKKILYMEVAKKFSANMTKGLSQKIREELGNLDEFKEIFKEILKNMAESVKGLKR